MRPDAPDVPRLEPCSEVNPDLWAYFCNLRGREVRPSDVWTEVDVVQHLDAAERAKKDNRVYRVFQHILHASER
jgi:hypothetical protein